MTTKRMSMAEILQAAIEPEDKRTEEERKYDCDAENCLMFLDISAAVNEMKCFAELLVEREMESIQILSTVTMLRSLMENMVTRLKALEPSVLEVHDSNRRFAMKEEAAKKYPPRPSKATKEDSLKMAAGCMAASTRMTKEEIDTLASQCTADPKLN